MAWTSAEKADIRYYTGWSARFLQTDSALEKAIRAVEGDVDVETLIRADIASCKDVDAKLLDADGRLKALKVGSIDLPGANEVRQLERKGRRFALRIASILGVEIRTDVFGTSGPRGRASHAGMLGGGNYAPHG